MYSKYKSTVSWTQNTHLMTLVSLTVLLKLLTFIKVINKDGNLYFHSLLDFTHTNIKFVKITFQKRL